MSTTLQTDYVYATVFSNRPSVPVNPPALTPPALITPPLLFSKLNSLTSLDLITACSFTTLLMKQQHLQYI